MNRDKIIYLLMVIATIFWAGAFIAGKYGVQEFSPLTLTFFTFLIASMMRERREGAQGGSAGTGERRDGSPASDLGFKYKAGGNP